MAHIPDTLPQLRELARTAATRAMGFPLESDSSYYTAWDDLTFRARNAAVDYHASLLSNLADPAVEWAWLRVLADHYGLLGERRALRFARGTRVFRQNVLGFSLEDHPVSITFHDSESVAIAAEQSPVPSWREGVRRVPGLGRFVNRNTTLDALRHLILFTFPSE